MVAPLRDVIARNPQRPSASAMAELRLNEERLGATLADRIRLRMNIVADAPLAPVKSLEPAAQRIARRLDV
ncbi:hypothetical protein PX701_13920 [Agromyces sp. H3Y2-19a]|uniref:phage terminase small subunit n=1 Tax=Agromyces chromiiresistens TaxID=3030835 RepID=UPI0023B8DF55|nr:hypothetical protein [Agromyces chromiiresistens]MDF0514724.1 hypothetical protein [Agromyces chromiiresistens]